MASMFFCIRVSNVVGTVMPNLGQVTGTSPELVLLWVQ
jgi:hypothetical protein